MGEKWLVGNTYQKNKFIEFIDQLDDKKSYEFEWKELKDTRTSQQNRAMHKYFKLLSEALNDAGLDFEQILSVEVPWNEVLIKELIWKPVMRSVIGEGSTTKQSTADIDKVYQILNRHFSSKHNLYVPFPDKGGP